MKSKQSFIRFTFGFIGLLLLGFIGLVGAGHLSLKADAEAENLDTKVLQE